MPVKVADPKSPINALFDGKDFVIADEIYMFRDDTALATDRRYLLVMDTEKMDQKDQGRRGSGRTGRTRSVGSTPTARAGASTARSAIAEEIFWNPTILKHYLAGIQYALGDLEADATPLKK